MQFLRIVQSKNGVSKNKILPSLVTFNKKEEVDLLVDVGNPTNGDNGWENSELLLKKRTFVFLLVKTDF